MNFDAVEGLTEEQIKKAYSEIIENGENDLLSTNGVVWFTKCTNGRSGYMHERNWTDHSVGFSDYSVQYSTSQSIASVCGTGQYGYTTIVAVVDDSIRGTIWYTKCSSGKTGYANQTRQETHWNGASDYSVQYSSSQSIAAVCGTGRYGYTVFATYY